MSENKTLNFWIHTVNWKCFLYHIFIELQKQCKFAWIYIFMAFPFNIMYEKWENRRDKKRFGELGKEGCCLTNLNKEFTLSRLPFFYTRGTQTFKRFFFRAVVFTVFFMVSRLNICQLHINWKRERNKFLFLDENPINLIANTC